MILMIFADTLWKFNIAMENIFFTGKIHCKWWFSIAMLNYQRVFADDTSMISTFLIDILNYFDDICSADIVRSLRGDMRIQTITPWL